MGSIRKMSKKSKQKGKIKQLEKQFGKETMRTAKNMKKNRKVSRLIINGTEVKIPEALAVMNAQFNVFCDAAIKDSTVKPLINDDWKLRASMGAFSVIFIQTRKLGKKPMHLNMIVSPEDMSKARTERWARAKYLDNVKAQNAELGLNKERYERRLGLLYSGGIETKARTPRGVEAKYKQYLACENLNIFVDDLKYVVEMYVRSETTQELPQELKDFIIKRNKDEAELNELKRKAAEEDAAESKLEMP